MTTLWDDVKPPKYPSLNQNLSVDVCVVGGGIAGLSIAYLLLREGKSVAVLEAKELGRGETGATSAHLSNALDDRYYNLEKFHGEKGARLAAESHTEAIERIQRIARYENIDCEFERVDGYLFASPKSDVGVLEKEFEAVHRAGLTTVEWADGIPWPSFNTGRCLRFPDQAQFHPLKYLFGLARAVISFGGRIFTGTHAVEFEGGSAAHVKTDEDYVVSAKSIVLATNVPINNRVAVHTKQAAYRTYVVGLKIPKEELPRVLCWDTADPYHYVRIEKFSSSHDILLVGGEDHKTGQGDDNEHRYDKLEAWTRKYFPMAGELAFKWSGQVIEPMDGLAFIGKNPLDSDNVFIVTGDSGNGLTHGTIGGMLIRDLILGRRNPWAELYDPSRAPINAIKEFVKENLNVVPQYKEWVTRGDIKSEERIKPGTGKIVRRGLQKIAAYRDKDGELHECSAVCPHLGCIVQWNSNEDTWDCPCHGSRFTPDGEVINGPANSNLPSLSPSHSRRS